MRPSLRWCLRGIVNAYGHLRRCCNFMGSSLGIENSEMTYFQRRRPLCYCFGIRGLFLLALFVMVQLSEAMGKKVDRNDVGTACSSLEACLRAAVQSGGLIIVLNVFGSYLKPSYT
jgi:hypothetical protein